MSDQILLQLNIAAITRVDPYVKDIVDHTSHVVVYTYDWEEKAWLKTDVDAALFIYSRNAEPYRSIFIDNKLNNTSLVEPITAQTEWKIEPPYLFLRNDVSRGRCFLFPNISECNRIGILVERTVQTCDKNSNYDAAQHPKQMNTNVDMFSILTKAHEDFNNPSACNNKTQPDLRRTNADIPSQSVMNFFAAAKTKKSKEIPNIQNLQSQPVHVNQIEKQQHMPCENKKSAPSSILNIAKSLGEKRLGASFKRTHSPIPPPKFGTDNLQTSNLPTSSIPLESTANKMKSKPKSILKIPKKSGESTPSRPPLMSPFMFSVKKHSADNDMKMTTIIEASSMNGIQLETSQLVQSGQPDKAEPLTQSQLLQAMSYLIKNDSTFVNKLHEVYLNFFTET